jgi:glycosyltransferase involved in cell wall biosynthesis
VLSGALGTLDQQIEHHQLWPWGPAGIRFELRHVLKKHLGTGVLYRLCMVLASLLLMPGMLIEKVFFRYESAWSWRFAARYKARQLCRRRQFDLIYSTGGAYAAHLAGCDLKKTLNIPWLAEVHDPFVTPGYTPVTAHEKMKLEVERRICTHADVAVWFTDQAMRSAERRHPQLAGRGRVILPGIDNPFGDDLPPYTPGAKMVIGHFGSLSKTRNLVAVIEALERLQQEAPDVLNDVELQVTGGPLDAWTQAKLENSPVRAHVRHLGRIEGDPATGLSGRAQILRRMRAADVLLLIHGQEPICEEYIPSKLYEYLWMQRPILAQVHRNAQMVGMLKNLGHVVIQTDASPNHPLSLNLMKEILTLYQQWQESGLQDRREPSPYQTSTAVAQLIQFVSPRVAV